MICQGNAILNLIYTVSSHACYQCTDVTIIYTALNEITATWQE